MRTTVRNSYTPKTGEYCNTIVVDNDKNVQYIFDSDGVWTTYTSKNQEGAPMSWVTAQINAAINTTEGYADSQDAANLTAAKSYADTKDALILQQAKDYTDQQGTGYVAKQYVDDQDADTLSAAKEYADDKDTALYGTVTGDISTAITNLHTTVTAEIGTAISTAPVITMVDTDPGEGVPLAANHFIAVYSGEESE